ncbi:hypothetical protein [Bartonella sp. AA16NXGY]|uniref:hypothetical protein n=1 Tax=Bartonella sp. AA16NXGY TaxID=3243428 RepID=UPI0035D09DB9
MTRWCWWVGLAVGGFGWGLVTGGLVGRGKRLERTSVRGFVSILWLEFFMD